MIKIKKKYAEFLAEVPMTTTGLLTVFIFSVARVLFFWSQGTNTASLLKASIWFVML